MEQADYAAAVAALRAQLLAYCSAQWAVATLDQDGLTQLVAAMTPIVQEAQQAIGSLTSVYIAEATGTQPVDVGDLTVLRGVSTEVVYSRPIVTARTLIVNGKPVAKAMEAGGRRLENLAGTDLQMAKVSQARESLRHSGRKFYRRVLTGSENCAMCMIASTQRYRVEDLLPIHPGCDCDVDVIPPGMDLDHVIDPGTLEETHQQVKAFTGISDRGGRAPDYRELIVSHQHGEVGPVLGWRGQNFTSKPDLK